MRRPLGLDVDELIAPIGSEDALVADLQREVAQLREALLTRQQIGVATGLVAQRFACSPDRAWSILVRISQDLNVKVREIAGVLGRAQAGETGGGDGELLARLADHLPGSSWVQLGQKQLDPARPDPARPDPARPDPARPDPARPDRAELGSADLTGAWIDGAGTDQPVVDRAFRAGATG